MNNITIKAPAKINLFLEVVGKRADGYHDLRMIMQTISLFDHVHISRINKGIEVECQASFVPQGEKNIAYKAAQLMTEHFGLTEGIKISIEKRIPVAAGLAGGSTDAAAVMKGLRSLFNIAVDDYSLAKLGNKIGADVPFCLLGGTVIAEGVGEKLISLEPFPGVDIVLIKPDFGVSTAYVFKEYSLNNKVHNKDKRCDMNELIEAMRIRNLSDVGSHLYNSLEIVTVKEHNIIIEIKEILDYHGAVGRLMSGSGPSVFGIFDNHFKARQAYTALKQKFNNTYLVHTI